MLPKNGVTEKVAKPIVRNFPVLYEGNGTALGTRVRDNAVLPGEMLRCMSHSRSDKPLLQEEVLKCTNCTVKYSYSCER